MGLTPIKRPNGAAKTLTWSCHACGTVRPDPEVGTVSIEGRVKGGANLRVTQRYCLASRACRAIAWAQAMQMFDASAGL